MKNITIIITITTSLYLFLPGCALGEDGVYEQESFAQHKAFAKDIMVTDESGANRVVVTVHSGEAAALAEYSADSFALLPVYVADELTPDELTPDELTPDELTPDELTPDELTTDEQTLGLQQLHQPREPGDLQDSGDQWPSLAQQQEAPIVRIAVADVALEPGVIGYGLVLQGQAQQPEPEAEAPERSFWFESRRDCVSVERVSRHHRVSVRIYTQRRRHSDWHLIERERLAPRERVRRCIRHSHRMGAGVTARREHAFRIWFSH
jgi:hypothetical protein